jgi:hypothetical protein
VGGAHTSPHSMRVVQTAAHMAMKIDSDVLPSSLYALSIRFKDGNRHVHVAVSA